MNVSELNQMLLNWASASYAEDFDNIGLLVGNYENTISGALITLDCTEEVINEAINLKFNTIITFHPIIFSGLKSITGKNYVEKVVLKAIQNDISIIAIHTNLDNATDGVNFEICNRLNLTNQKILIPKEKQLLKLTTYIPKSHFKVVQNALFEAKVGAIGNYEECSFYFDGIGTFKPNESANPFLGEIGKQEISNETCLNVIFEDFQKENVLKTLKNSHPYEEISYEIVRLENKNQTIGMGRIGELPNELSEIEFLQFAKEKLPTKCIRHSKLLNKNIKKVAVLGGSGSFAISNAIKEKVDVFITADLKYHDFFRAENKLVLLDLGHYESEQFTKNLIFNYLIKKSVNFAFQITTINTNSVNYF